VPPPNIYDVSDKVHSTKTYKIYQSERKTLMDDLEKLKTKDKVPMPGAYNPKPVEPKLIGPIKSTVP